MKSRLLKNDNIAEHSKSQRLICEWWEMIAGLNTRAYVPTLRTLPVEVYWLLRLSTY